MVRKIEFKFIQLDQSITDALDFAGQSIKKGKLEPQLAATLVTRRPYIISTRRMIAEEILKYRNGLLEAIIRAD